MIGSSAPSSSASAAGVPDISVRTGIVYATHGAIDLAADLYVPNGVGPFPVVIAVPGGGWRQTVRAGHRQWGRYVATRGIALFSIDYRIAGPGKMFPEAVCDVITAVQYLRGSAEALGLDPTRIGLMGGSAGAHLASLAALAASNPRFQSPRPANKFSSESTNVKALVGICGVYDMYAFWQQEIAETSRPEKRRTELFMGTSPYSDRQLYFDASPVSHVRCEACALPVFLVYGTADEIVHASQQTLPFMRALREAGFAVRDLAIPGAGHFWFGEEPIEEPGSFSGYLAPRLFRFLAANL